MSNGSDLSATILSAGRSVRLRSIRRGGWVMAAATSSAKRGCRAALICVKRGTHMANGALALTRPRPGSQRRGSARAATRRQAPMSRGLLPRPPLHAEAASPDGYRGRDGSPAVLSEWGPASSNASTHSMDHAQACLSHLRTPLSGTRCRCASISISTFLGA